MDSSSSRFLFACLFLSFSSWFFVGFSRNLGEQQQELPSISFGDLGEMRNVSQGLEGLLGNASGLGAGGGASGSMSCIQNLLPCKAYLKSSSPPSSCCDPLKEMASNNSQCLCSVLDNPELLKTFNVSQDEALQLPKACGADIDLSKCKDAASPTDSPTNSSSSTPSSSSNNNNVGSSDNSSNSSSPESAAANGIPQLSVLLSFVGLYVAFVFSSI